MTKYLITNPSQFAIWKLEETGKVKVTRERNINMRFWFPSKNANENKILDQLKRTKNIDGFQLI